MQRHESRDPDPSMIENPEDAEYMQRALALAERGCNTTWPNPRVGCVLVREGSVVGEGWHQRCGGAHAEVHALHDAGEKARGATAYVTLEPCAHTGRTPPCADTLIDAGVTRAVVAVSDPFPAVAGRRLATLRDAGVEVVEGVCAAAAREVNRGFFRRIESGRPWITLKLAASLDGRTATGSGESQWISSKQARRDVHRLRARCDAILTGSGTVLADDPSLTARDLDEPVLQPLRVVLDTRARVPPDARVLGGPQPALLFAATADPRSFAGNVDRVQAPGADGRVDLAAVFDELARREVNEVLVESGAELAGSLLQGGWVDELILYLAPSLIGHQGRPLIHLPGRTQLNQCPRFETLEMSPIGPDFKLRLRPILPIE